MLELNITGRRVRESCLLSGVVLAAASGCALGEHGSEEVGRSAQGLTLGPATTFATTVLSAEAVATETGYALAYVTQDPDPIAGHLNNAHLAFLDQAGTLIDGPYTFLTKSHMVNTLGVAWDGSAALAVVHHEQWNPDEIIGYLGVPGSPPILAFSQDEQFINDSPANAQAKMLGRPVFHDGVFWVSGMNYSAGKSTTCFGGGVDLETAGGYRFDGTITMTTCGLAVTGPGAAAACLSREYFHDDCMLPDQIELRVDTLPPGAPVAVSTPPFSPKRIATHDDVVLVLGKHQTGQEQHAISITTSGAVIGVPPIALAPELDVGYVVDRFVVVTEQAGTIHAVTLDPSGTSVVDAEVEVVPTGTRPFLAPRQDGTALLGYFVGEELKLGIFEVTSSSSTSSSSASSSSDSAASSGAGPVTTTTASGGSSGGAGGAANDADDDDGGGNGCSTAGVMTGTNGAIPLAASVLLLTVRRRRRTPASGGAHAQN